MIELDVQARRLDLMVDKAELERRRKAAQKAQAGANGRRATRGYRQLYVEHVLQAPQGCDFDFLLGRTPVETHVEAPEHAAGHHTG
jgi:dihydroxy-acid dehydratase